MELETPGAPAQAAPGNAQGGTICLRPFARFAWFAAALSLAFCVPLYGLVRLAFHSSLYSHVLLIPFITFYLIWIRRVELLTLGGTGVSPVASFPSGASVPPAPHLLSSSPSASPDFRVSASAALPLALGALLVAGYWGAPWGGRPPAREDFPCLPVPSFVPLFASARLRLF